MTVNNVVSLKERAFQYCDTIAAARGVIDLSALSTDPRGTAYGYIAEWNRGQVVPYEKVFATLLWRPRGLSLGDLVAEVNEKFQGSDEHAPWSVGIDASNTVCAVPKQYSAPKKYRFYNKAAATYAAEYLAPLFKRYIVEGL